MPFTEKRGGKGNPLVSLRQKLRTLKIQPKKRFGQHFVVDPQIIQKVVAAAVLDPEDVVLEIGSGLGSLTVPLAERVKRVYAVEIDPALAQALREETPKFSQVEVIQADALQLDFSSLDPIGTRKMKVVANLPYEISSPMVFRLFEQRKHFSLFILMFQKEVARRIVASPGKKDYGPLSIWTQLYSQARILFLVPPQAFFPPPQVDSAVVQFKILESPRFPLKDPQFFEKVIRSAFTYRRKTIANALKLGGLAGLPPGKILEGLARAHIGPQVRGETLSLEQFYILSQELSAQL